MAAWFADILDPDAALVVQVAWGADLTADPATWVWTDVTTDVYQDPGVAISKARGDEASTSQPAQCSFKLRNETGTYSAGGESANYPYVRQGTPIRVRIDPDGAGYHTLFHGNAIGFTPDWRSPRSGSVAVTAAGTLRRLGQGQAPIQSSMRRDVEADPTTVAYWTCEEEGRAGAFIASVGNYFMTWVTPPDLARESYFECSKPLPVLKGSWWSTSVAMAATGEWLVRFLAKFPEDLTKTGTNGANIVTIFTSGTAAVWRLNWFNGAATGQYELAVYESDLTPIYASGVFTAEINQALMGALVSISADQNGADIDLAFAQSAIIDDAANTYGFSDTIAGHTMGAVTGLWFGQSGELDEVTIGHVAVHNDVIPFWEGLDAARAWRGETADDRLARLATETSETVTVSGISYVTMGPQLPKTVLELYRECEAADGGTLYDGDAHGLSYECRENRENRAPDMTLVATSSQVKRGFDPTHDDQRIRNRAVISRVAAGSFTYADATGPLGVDVVGAYETSATVSLYDDIQQQNYAAWVVHLGTVEGYRYPTITVNLAHTPSLVDEVLALKPGHRIDITGLDTALIGHPGGTLSLAIEGVRHQLSSRNWVVTFACSPYSPWNVLELDDGNASPVAYITSGTAATGNNASLSVSPPTAYNGDDLLVLVASIRNSGTGTVDTPAGWTVLKTFGNVTVFGWLEARETYPAAGAVTTTTVTFTGGVANATTLAQMFALRGTKARRLTNLADVVHNSATQLNGSAQDCAMPALTVSQDNCAILALVWKADDFTSASNPYSYVDFPVVTNSTLGDDACMFAAYGVQGAHANLSSGTYTITGGGAAISRAIVLAFLPDPTPPPLPQLDTAGSTLNASISAGATSMSMATTACPDVTYVGIGAAAIASSGSVSPALPAGWAVGDLLLVYASTRNAGTGTVDTIAGWTALATQDNTKLLGRLAEAGDVAPTVTFTGGAANETTIAQCFALRGTDPNINRVVQTSATQSNAAATNIAVPGLTVGEESCAVLVLGWRQDDFTSIAQLSGQFFTEVSDTPTTTGSDAGIEIQYRINVPGVTQNFSSTSLTVTTGGGTAVSRSMVVAIRKSSVGAWTTNTLDYPLDLDVGGVKVTATACTDSISPQTMTITAAPVARTIGAAVKLWRPAVLSRPKGL